LGTPLLDRWLQARGLDHHALTPIDRLAAVGLTGMGALSYQPKLDNAEGLDPTISLDWFADEISRVQGEQSVG
jgi:serine/threonine-protein kinase HipA